MNTESNLGKKQGRRLVFVALVSLLILMLLGSTSAGAQFLFTEDLEGSDVFTGCVNQSSGGLRSVAIGLEPAKECGEGEFQITWDRAEPAFESRIAALEERVVELEGQFGTLNLFVDCDAGDTVGAALADADTHVGQVNITISGVCDESIYINRDDVYISGVQPTDGIRGPIAGIGSAVHLHFAHRVGFSNMTISGGWEGLSVRGSSFEVSNVTIRDARWSGIVALGGASGRIRDSSIFGHIDAGVIVGMGSVIDIDNCGITNNGTGVQASFNGGGTISIRNSEIVNNGGGADAGSGGNLSLSNTLVADNLNCGVSASGAEISLNDDTHIINNGTGVRVSTGSSANASYGVVVEYNHREGILVHESSTLKALGVIVRYNEGDGIGVNDLSVVSIWASQIINNDGWGIYCGGPPAIAVLGGQGIFDPVEIDLSGNTLGDTNCQ